MTDLTDSKQAYKEAISAMTVRSSPYFKDYVFYLHILAQCRIVFNPDLPATAAVGFSGGTYTLFLNPSEYVTPPQPDQPPHYGFVTKLPLEQRLGIIKHEMKHITGVHFTRFPSPDFDHKLVNYATDCAINQDIPKNHLPDYVVTLKSLSELVQKDLEPFESSEYYYNELLQAAIPLPSLQSKLDDHSSWEEVQDNPDFIKEITKTMVESAAKSTLASKGNLPKDYAEIIDNLTVKRTVNWQTLLRRIIGNRRALTERTFMRKSRRLSGAKWIQGKKRAYSFNIAVISDVSGSVDSSTQLRGLWSEILGLCSSYRLPVTLVQIDTQPSDPIRLTSSTTVITRQGNGGTQLYPAAEKLKETKTPYDVLVVTTDGHLFSDDLTAFQSEKVPVIFIVPDSGIILPQMQEKNCRAVKLPN